ncbi:hypothetical protein DRJ19_03810 [Candidatus Woesearchaeota archaeon]|nr:MAG: hypothetical protein DRJ16_06480 [Candidatus Woesearchaeota archaeon]RLE42634.1 MAG: hypothetical protein DRJ19_03810 [Candidatus Woesearchaeota archaeon]
MRAVDLILFYMAETGRISFTYESLRRFMYRMIKAKRLPWVNWHTIERGVRDLAQRGYLLRFYSRNRKKVWFRAGPAFFKALNLPPEISADPRLLRKYIYVKRP